LGFVWCWVFGVQMTLESISATFAGIDLGMYSLPLIHLILFV
jgi:hypothetical protein